MEKTRSSANTTAYDLLSITSEIGHQRLSDNSNEIGKASESQPAHRLHHPSQEQAGTHARACTRAPNSKDKPFKMSVVRTETFLSTSHN